MSVVVSVQDVGPCRKQLTVEVPPQEVAAEASRVARDLAKRVQLPGFRRGKVPLSLLRKRYAEDIDRQVVDNLLPRYWREARQESGLDPLLPPEVTEVGEVAEGRPLTFTAVVETRPQIELGELTGFELPEIEVEPTDEELQRALDDLRRSRATWRPVEREAARGDRVRLTIVEVPGAGEDEAAGEPERRSAEIEVGDERVWEELSLAVTGLSAGQRGSFRRRGEPGEGGAVGPERRFEVEVEEVAERELPELTDELARELGDFADVEALRGQLRDHLRRRREAERVDRRRGALLEQLRQRHPLTLPQGVVEHEVEGMLRRYAESLAHQGVDVERAEIDWQRLGADVRPQAERRVHDRLLLDAVAEREGIEVGDEELERAIAELARSEGASVPAFRRALAQGDRLEGLRRDVRRDKTLRHLLEEPTEMARQEPISAP